MQLKLDNSKIYAIALEGGGAKGAYEIGAYRALTEMGYRFDVICGVSIGAINAALLAQGDCEKAAEFWETTSNDDLFSEEDKGFLEIINRQVNLNTLSALKENIKAAVENGLCDKGADVTVKLLGGDLIVNYTDERVTLTGGATLVYEGTSEY